MDDSNIFFDINGDGFKHRTAWPVAGDGLLAYDVDGNGKIDNSSEISFAGYKDGAQTDLEGLRAFDTNSDGIFSAADAKWNKFGVWQDVNQNGVSDPGEFRTLGDLGVASVALASDGQFSVIDGQTVHGVGTVNMADGSTLPLADVTLQYSNDVLITYPDGTSQVVNKPPFSPSGEVLSGTDGDDLILGKTGNNVIYAGAGNDVVFEDGGNDVIDGGDGNDTIYSGADNDLVMAGAGDDVVFAGLGSDMVFGGDGHDALFGEGGNDVIFGGAGNDLISGDTGNDVLSGDAGNDQVYGGSGNDALFGGAGDDELAGMEGYDRLDGGVGNDLLDGGAGADEMIGGAGDDTYVVDNIGDIVTENSGAGTDSARSSISYTLAATLENLTLTGTENLTGTGNDADNVLIGNSGNNTLVGDAGNDTLNGGAGADMLIGGAGDDTYIVDNTGDQVSENPNEGIDTVLSSVNYALTDNVENLTLTGIADLTSAGNGLDNVIIGNSGNNLLDGGAGADTLAGGRGSDAYVIDNAGDQVIENVGEGNDTVRSSIDYTLVANVENLELTGVAVLGGGNELDNTLTGNANNNMLDGAAGVDAMAGGAGSDTYIVDNAGDTVVENASEGVDLVLSSVSYVLSDNVENLTLTGMADINGTGNNLNNLIVGNSGNSTLDGGAGADLMSGGAGDDIYIVDNAGDLVTENVNEGMDLVQSSITYALTDNVENLTLTGSADINGTGNALDNVLTGNSGNNVLDGGLGTDSMTGGAGSDTYMVDNAGDQIIELVDGGVDTVVSSISWSLADNVENLTLVGMADINGTGNVLDNVILGNAGNNVLDGGAGADTMLGGAGNDTYIVDNGNDVVTENINEGTEIIFSSVTYALSGNVENLTLTGSADINGTGNSLDNIIVGNSGANIIDGGAGVDAMTGNAGDDTYIVDNAGDTVVELAGDGIDIIYSSVSYVLPEHVENLTLTGMNPIDGTGNGLDNILIGNVGDNILFGLGGSDQLFGLDGNDHLDGGVGADLLSGGAGNDVLTGGNGNDQIQGGAGNDTFVYNLGDDLDTLTDSAGIDSVQFGSGISFDTVAIHVSEADGVKTAHLRILDAGGCEMPDQGMDFVLDVNGASPVESFQFADGSSYTMDDLLIRTKYFYGNSKTTTLHTGRHDDIIYAGPMANAVYAGTGNDIVYGQQRNDLLYGEGGDDYLVGGEGNDVLDGGCGVDILAGGNGNDVLRDVGDDDNAALLGGHGRDAITSGAANDFIAGGKHDDILDGGTGYNVFAFNKEDGRDVILPAAGARNTLSLGDVDYDDLKFRKSGNDLSLELDGDSRITFQGWYADAANRNFLTLQVVNEWDERGEHHEYEHHDDEDLPFDALVETFDFQALVDKFDQARSTNVTLDRWGLMDGMLDTHLASSDTMALGGDLAFQYAQENSLKGMSLFSAQAVLKDATFGAQAQAINPSSSINTGTIALA